MIEALIISCQEPQRVKCIRSVYAQVPPFKNVLKIFDVTPEYKAFQMGIDNLREEWAIIINGDMILYEDASKVVYEKVKNNSEGVGEFQFGLYDPFVMRTINQCSVYRTKLLKEEGRIDSLQNDFIASRNIAKKGWLRVNLFNGPNKVVIGTHFEDPDDFQIFRRFFIRGIKGDEWTYKYLYKLYRRTKLEKYQFAIKAFDFGRGKSYPGSHNINFDREMYERFLKEG